MPNDPPPVITIPWQSLTVVLDASVSEAGARLTFATLNTAINSQVLQNTISPQFPFEVRLHRVRVWQNTDSSTGPKSFSMVVYDIFEQSNAAGTDIPRALSTRNDTATKLNYAKLQYTYNRVHRNIPLNLAAVGTQPIITLTSGTFKIYLDIAYRFCPQAIPARDLVFNGSATLTDSPGGEFKSFGPSLYFPRYSVVSKTDEDQVSSLAESLGDDLNID